MALLLWITGLAGSGKTTLAKKVFSKLKRKYPNLILLDGDDFREIMQNELGYDRAARLQNAWRIARLCHFLTKQGIHVICSTMSLYKEIHRYNRKKQKNYLEVFVDVDMKELIRRDKKGLYSAALRGDKVHVVGINASYDKPRKALVLHNGSGHEMKLNVKTIIEKINKAL